MGRAELRRQAKFEAKKISVDTVSQKTKIKVDLLMQWRQQEHDELERQICLEYQKKLERAEDLILAAMVFSSMLAVRDTWKLKLDLQKYFDNLMMERDLAFSGQGSEGILKAMERVEKESGGMKFEFDAMDLNQEFHIGDWEANTDIEDMTPIKAYEHGWSEFGTISNIMHTCIFADEMYGKTMLIDGEEITMGKPELQQMINTINNRCRELLKHDDGKQLYGTGKLGKLMQKVEKETGLNFGDYAREKVNLYGM